MPKWMEKLDKLLPGWLFVAAWAVFSGIPEGVSGLEAPLYWYAVILSYVLVLVFVVMMIRAPQAERIVRPTTRDEIVRCTAMVTISIGVGFFAFPRPFEFDLQLLDLQFFSLLAVPLFIVFNIVYNLILRHPIYDVARTAVISTIFMGLGGFVLTRSIALFWRVAILLAIVFPLLAVFDSVYPDRRPAR